MTEDNTNVREVIWRRENAVRNGRILGMNHAYTTIAAFFCCVSGNYKAREGRRANIVIITSHQNHRHQQQPNRYLTIIEDDGENKMQKINIQTRRRRVSGERQKITRWYTIHILNIYCYFPLNPRHDTMNFNPGHFSSRLRRRLVHDDDNGWRKRILNNILAHRQPLSKPH